MITLNATSLRAFQCSLISYAMMIGLTSQINHMSKLENDEARAARGRIVRYVNSMLRVLQLLENKVVPLIMDRDVAKDQDFDPVLVFFQNLKHTSDEFVKPNVNFDSEAKSKVLKWFIHVDKIYEVVSDNDVVTEIFKSIQQNRLSFLRDTKRGTESNAGESNSYVHLCPKLAIIEKLTSVHINYEISNNFSEHWVSLCGRVFSLLDMNCQQNWNENENLVDEYELPYHIKVDLNKIILRPVVENLRRNKDNYAQDVALHAVKAILYQMSFLIFHNPTEEQLEEGESFSVSARGLISALETSKRLSKGSNKGAYANTPPKDQGVHETKKILRRFAFMVGDKGLVNMMDSFNIESGGNGECVDESITPLQKRVLALGSVPLSVLEDNGDSPVMNLTAMLEKEMSDTSTSDGSSKRKKRTSWTQEERDMVNEGRNAGLNWVQIMERYPILAEKGKDAQKIRDMFFNQNKNKRVRRDADATQVNKPKRKYSLQEKLAVVKGVLSGHDWKDIIDKNTTVLVGRTKVDVKDLWRNIKKNVNDESILECQQKLMAYLVDLHSS